MNSLITTDKRVIALYLFGAFLALLVLNISSIAILFPFVLVFLLATLISPDVAYISIVASIPVALEIGGGLTVTTALMPMAILFLLMNASVGRCHWPITVTGAEALFSMGFFLTIVISAILSANVGFAIKDSMVTIVFFIIFFTTLTYIKDEESLKRLIWVLIITGIVEALITVAQVKIGFTLPGKWRLTNMETLDLNAEFRADGTTTHPITLAHFLQLTIVTTVAQIMWSRTLWIKIILVAGLGVMLMAWYYSFSRSSFIAVGGTLGLALFMKGKAWRYSIMVVGIFSVLLMLTLKFESFSDLLQRVEAMSFFSGSAAKLNINAGSDSYGFRTEQFVGTWGLFLEHPIVGVGFDQGIRHYVPYLPSWAVSYIHPEVIHNIFLAVMCELGLLGLVAFFGLWISAFRSIKNAWTHEQFGRYSKLVFLILIGQIVVGAMNPIMREIWLSLAMAGAIGKLAISNKTINYNDQIIRGDEIAG